MDWAGWLEKFLTAGMIYLVVGGILTVIVFVVVLIFFIKVWKEMSKDPFEKQKTRLRDRSERRR